jgi:hypothetical protein
VSQPGRSERRLALPPRQRQSEAATAISPSAPLVRCHAALSSTSSFAMPLHPLLSAALTLSVPHAGLRRQPLSSTVYTPSFVVRCHEAFSSARCGAAAPSCPCELLGSALGLPHTLGRETPCAGSLPQSRIGLRAVVHEQAGQIRPSTVELFSIFRIYIQILAI